MFISLPKALGIFGSVLSVGGIGTGAVYATTQKTISDSLGEIRIVSKDNVDEFVWEKLKKRLDGTDEPKPIPKSQIFVGLKGKDKKELGDVCQEIGKNIYWTIFSKDSDLMEDVKNFCSITIKDSFEEEPKLLSVEKFDDTNTNKNEFEKNIENLNSNEINGSFHKSLDDLRKKIKEPQRAKNHWLDLVKWCSETYKSYFFNKSDVLWKNVNTYCKK